MTTAKKHMTKEEFEQKHPKLFKAYQDGYVKYAGEDVLVRYSYWDVLDFMYEEGVKAGLAKANKLADLGEKIHGQSEEEYVTIKKEDLEKLQNEKDELSAGLTEYVDTYAEKRRKVEQLEKEKEELESKLQSCEEANKSLRKQISEDSRALEKEHDDMFNRPTVLAAKLGAFGYQGELTRKQPFYNMDEKMGEYVETLTIGTNGKA
jgi:predicted nuclease with TOPRIM domain